MKLEFSRQILEKSLNIKFHRNLFGASQVVPCGEKDGQTDRQTDERDESNSRFSQFF